MKGNLKIKLFLVTFFLLQAGYFLTGFPVEAFLGNTYLPAYFIFSFSVIAITFELYFIVKELVQNAKLNTELAIMRQQQTLKEEQAAGLAKQRAQTELVQQNITQQLSTYQNYMAEANYEKANSYLKEMTAKFQQERFRPCCSDGLLNAILENKRQIAASHNISVTYELLLPEKSRIAATDLSCIFFNLLDNGIEACIRSMNGNENQIENQKPAPFLHLTVNTNAGFLAIHMRNSKNPALTFNRISSKADAQNHGFGLSIIEDCAARNDGTCQWQDEGDHFDSMVLLRYE